MQAFNVCLMSVGEKELSIYTQLEPWGIHYFSFAFISNLGDFRNCLILRGMSFQTVLGPGFGL